MIEPRFLLDTNILVYLLAGKSTALRRQLEAHEPGSVATSALCVAEALIGTARNGEQASFDALLAVIAPLPFDLAAAGRVPLVSFRGGKFDRLIAAHALALDLTLITANEGDFADVPGLRIENWTR